ncbi:unnamed protein product [Sphagnum troendelagicum]
MLVEVTPATSGLTPDAAIEGSRVNREESVRSKDLSHFIKGKISLTPMETVMMILGELEHLESLLKVARKKKDAEAANNQIGAIVDVEQGLIQVKRGPGADVELLPLTMVNLMQISDSANSDRNDDCTQRHASGNSGAMDEASYLSQQGTSEQSVELESESDSESSEDSNEGTQLVGSVDGESDFGDPELEKLVMLEGPQQILQLTMQHKADDFMKEELTDADDYADWIQWAVDEEQRMQSLSEEANAAEESVLLQIQQMEIADSSGDVKE